MRNVDRQNLASSYGMRPVSLLRLRLLAKHDILEEDMADTLELKMITLHIPKSNQNGTRVEVCIGL